MGFGFRVLGFGFRVSGFGFKVQGSGFRAQGSGLRAQGSGFRVQGSGVAAPAGACFGAAVWTAAVPPERSDGRPRDCLILGVVPWTLFGSRV